MKPNVQRWIKGLFSALIGGGAGAVVASVTAVAFDPEKFNPMVQLWHFVSFMFCVFIGSGLLHMFIFLQQHPLPDDNTTIITKS